MSHPQDIVASWQEGVDEAEKALAQQISAEQACAHRDNPEATAEELRAALLYFACLADLLYCQNQVRRACSYI